MMMFDQVHAAEHSLNENDACLTCGVNLDGFSQFAITHLIFDKVHAGTDHSKIRFDYQVRES